MYVHTDIYDTYVDGCEFGANKYLILWHLWICSITCIYQHNSKYRHIIEFEWSLSYILSLRDYG